MTGSFSGNPDRGASLAKTIVTFLLLALAVYGYFAWQAYQYRARRDEVLQLMKDVYAQCLAPARDDPPLARRIELTKAAINTLKPEDSFGLLVVFEAELADKGCTVESLSPSPPPSKYRPLPAAR
jgi:hypothetical protein